MDIQQKLTGFAMMGATWIMWLLVALSIGASPSHWSAPST